MNKSELITSISTKSGLTKVDAEKALKGIIESIEETLAKGEKVQLVGFGTFEPRQRAARVGRNPRTKEEIQIAATTVPAFKPGKEFKDNIKK
jgi:DNA-binding protein HU-beta